MFDTVVLGVAALTARTITQLAVETALGLHILHGVGMARATARQQVIPVFAVTRFAV